MTRTNILCLAILLSFTLDSFAQQRQDVDLIVAHGIVVTMDEGRDIYQDGAVAVRGDAIVAVGARSEIESRFKAAQVIDARGGLVLPGFINGHTHVPMTLFRGLHDDVTLNDWLYKYIFPAEAKNVNEEFVRWGTRLAAAEQIRAAMSETGEAMTKVASGDTARVVIRRIGEHIQSDLVLMLKLKRAGIQPGREVILMAGDDGVRVSADEEADAGWTELPGPLAAHIFVSISSRYQPVAGA